MVTKMKRAAVLLLICFLACGLCLPSLAAAGTGLTVAMEQVQVDMPSVRLYFYPSDVTGKFITDLTLSNTTVTAALNNEPLAVNDLSPAKAAGTAYIFLYAATFDMPDVMPTRIRQALKSWKADLDPADKMLLLDCGGTVQTVLDGEETLEAASEKIDQLGQSANPQFQAGVHRAISIASADANDLPERKVLIAISNGEAVTTATESADELTMSLNDACLPLYALAYGETKNYLSALSGLAASTHGDYQAFVSKTAEQTMQSMHSRLDSCYVLDMQAATNLVEPANRSLSVQFSSQYGDASLSQPITVKRWTPDEAAPTVTAVEALSANELRLTFSENVTGADSAANFRLLHGGKTIPVKGAAYDAAAFTATLTVGETLYNGDYSLELSNIRDVSVEANAVTFEGGKGDYPFTVATLSPTPSPTPAPTPEPTPEPEDYTTYYIAGGAGLFLLIAAGVVVLLLAKQRKKAAEAHEKQLAGIREDIGNLAGDIGNMQPPEPDPNLAEAGVHGGRIRVDGISGVSVLLMLSHPNGVHKNVDAIIGASPFTIGRGTVCDLSVDDKTVSTKHCALRCQDGRLYLCDLGSTNGTLLNGYPVTQEYPINDNDILQIGNTKITVQRQSYPGSF